MNSNETLLNDTVYIQQVSLNKEKESISRTCRKEFALPFVHVNNIYPGSTYSSSGVARFLALHRPSNDLKNSPNAHGNNSQLTTQLANATITFRKGKGKRNVSKSASRDSRLFNSTFVSP